LIETLENKESNERKTRTKEKEELIRYKKHFPREEEH